MIIIIVITFITSWLSLHLTTHIIIITFVIFITINLYHYHYHHYYYRGYYHYHYIHTITTIIIIVIIIHIVITSQTLDPGWKQYEDTLPWSRLEDLLHFAYQ